MRTTACTLLMLSLVSHVVAGAQGQMSPRDVVERFCQLDLADSLLTPAGDAETARFLVSPFRWTRDQTVVVIDGYTLSGSADTDVNYRVWGQLDSSLAS